MIVHACVPRASLAEMATKHLVMCMFHTAGFPASRNQTPHQCFDREFKLTCHHEYETTSPHVWCMNGIPVEHGSQFAIDNADRSITLLDVDQSRYANKETSFQCCVEWTNGPQVCGEYYIFDPLGEIHACC